MRKPLVFSGFRVERAPRLAPDPDRAVMVRRPGGRASLAFPLACACLTLVARALQWSTDMNTNRIDTLRRALTAATARSERAAADLRLPEEEYRQVLADEARAAHALLSEIAAARFGLGRP